MPKQTQAPRTRLAGFTLIELMIAVVILGILGTIAATAYTSEVKKSRRTDARTALLDLAAREEKLFSTTNAYTSSPLALGISSATTFPTAGVSVGSGYYTVNVAVPDTAQASAAGTYALTATPVATGPQAADTQCTTLAVNQLGVQSSTGTGTAATCWGTSN